MPPPPRAKAVVTAHPGSLAREIETEPNWQGRHSDHRVGYRNSDHRIAGITSDSDPHDVQNEEHEEFVEDAMSRHRELREREKRGELVNFQDVMEAQTDFKRHSELKYPPMWHYVVNTTEDFVKYQQDWPANKARKEKEEKQKVEEKQKEKQNDGQKDKAEPKSGDGKREEGKNTGEQAESMNKQENSRSGRKEEGKGPEKQADGGRSDRHDNEQDKQTETEAKEGYENRGSDTDGPSGGETDVSSEPEGDAIEDDFRQNRGGPHSTKHNDAYGPRDTRGKEVDAEYEKLREKYTPEEIALLRSLRHEKGYMSNILQNDGRMLSPVKIKDVKHHILGVDKQDTMTPDNWVPRSPNLHRWTGQHPMNGEPRLQVLMGAGFITPNQLHYVRNHGAVPRLYWETHKLDVNNGKLILTMDELRDQFEPINIPVFMACDGNRRGEMNKIKKSKGFDWGAGGMSNAFWKGARLCDVLTAAGVSQEHVKPGKRLHVNFEGADDLSEGKYQTSVALEYIMDPCNDVLLAYEMNNTPLPPDHGFPVRLMLPGFVGGRNVKWLAKIWISVKENTSHYHIWDNRVLPSFITEKDGEFAQVMFHHPNTACYEQNLNSIIVRPAQDEKLQMSELMRKKSYRVEGVAYDGGGHEVQRVEVSIDEGKTWLYAVRKLPERPIRHGRKFWTWCFWHVDIDALHISRAESIVVRAFNVFKNTQPESPVWNVMGMMNNCWYRVKMNIDKGHVICRHPIDIQGHGGWMKSSTENQLNAAKQDSGVPDKQFTRAEVEKHNKKDDCWLVINNNVYDATSVLEWHPGGAATILANSGTLSDEVTGSFKSIHDDYAHKKLQECAIGRITDKAVKYLQQRAEADAAAAAKETAKESATFLQRKRWLPVRLKHRKQLSQDTFRYTFQYREEGSNKSLGLGTCQHIEFGIHMLDKMCVRQYTPTRPIMAGDEDGTFDLIVKTYFPDENQPGGAFGNMLLKLDIGEKIQVSGPSGEIKYVGNGKFDIEGKEMEFSKVNLVLGGTGITPGYALIEHVVRDRNDKTRIRAIDANKSVKDILLKEELDKFEDEHAEQFSVTHVLSHPQDSDKWEGENGHVNADIIKKALFAPGEGVATFLCGPPAMIQKAALPALLDWGFDEDKDIWGF